MPSAYPLSDRHLLVFVSTECSHHCLNDLSLDARRFMVDSVISWAFHLHLRLFSKWYCLGLKYVQE
jgi:hypothetical protein